MHTRNVEKLYTTHSEGRTILGNRFCWGRLRKIDNLLLLLSFYIIYCKWICIIVNYYCFYYFISPWLFVYYFNKLSVLKKKKIFFIIKIFATWARHMHIYKKKNIKKEKYIYIYKKYKKMNIKKKKIYIKKNNKAWCILYYTVYVLLYTLYGRSLSSSVVGRTIETWRGYDCLGRPRRTTMCLNKWKS